MDSPSPTSPPSSKDRLWAVGMLTLAALLACGWLTRERQLATDLAESREDLRQALHRLTTVTSSTEQIRTAYLQRKSELEITKKKLEGVVARQSEEKSKELRILSDDKPKSTKSLVALKEKLTKAKLPPWAALETSETSIRVLPGVGLAKGTEGFAAFGSLARALNLADPETNLELIARAEPGAGAWETAQDRAAQLIAAAEKSFAGETSPIRLRVEISKGPRMEWRLFPPEAAARPTADTKNNRK